jgi:hypothetical protein
VVEQVHGRYEYDRLVTIHSQAYRHGVARTEQQDEQSDVEFIDQQSPARQFPEVRSIDLPIHAARKTAPAGAAQAHTRIHPSLRNYYKYLASILQTRIVLITVWAH